MNTPGADGDPVVIEALGEDALLLRLPARIDAQLNRRVHAIAAAIAHEHPPWLMELVPAYASLALRIADDADVRDPLAHAERWLRDLLARVAPGDAAQGVAAPVEIPVCYGGDHGPDLDDVARHCGLTVAQVVDRHSRGDYGVAMLGFAPGFPYLLGLDPALATPRLDTPRTRVPAGSVGIGGAQTGVYPGEGPGGWRLLGRTPLSLFDAARERPTLLAPGDRVRFVPIDAGEFARRASRRGRAAP